MKFIQLLFLIFTLSAFSQNKMKIYYLENRYNNDVKNVLMKSNNFSTYNLLIQYYMDPKNEGIIDLEFAKKYIKKIYPNKYDTGVLCINLENQIFKDLKNYNNGKIYRNARKEFKTLLKTIKSLRPNLKIGIYGLPFRIFYDSQLKWNKPKKFDSLFKCVDIIFPSLYIMYPQKQTSLESNIKYFEKNLKEALKYGVRLNKEVIPFFDYKVHFSNKKYGSELLPFDEVKYYLNFIENYSYNTKKVNGVVWWELNNKLFLKGTKVPPNLKGKDYLIDQNYLIRKYLQDYFTTKQD